jgi:hypothetical protein
MRTGLEPLIKDRSWRFQSYKDCFKHSHEVSWALENVDPDEGRAVEVLNELVDMRLVSHVVDPTTKFRVGENRRLYFKMNKELLENEFESGNKTDTLVANRLGSSSNNNNNNNNNTHSRTSQCSRKVGDDASSGHVNSFLQLSIFLILPESLRC